MNSTLVLALLQHPDFQAVLNLKCRQGSTSPMAKTVKEERAIRRAQGQQRPSTCERAAAVTAGADVHGNRPKGYTPL